ncbi:ferredoxin adrenodoxin reductase [Coniophora puteana RWD-64-598 SS2]|uniref:NADPH:adrenodoxin oxidoreductase, mitochondrial n=1 Tax=Coniophora puteana (strain RWD-64-598) TaxID=741705 RepID=A0A5M3MUQ7_CONPW|nr:ferredoxin adrenodoxin reductase [Coniophora puteana RWD-64-598 SS2]EIW82908.1 ferredoxin adrenodoxin reductase [Coniophora puteana RWD-64-598 SS2]
MPPVKLAVVGGGPSAFYVTSRLLSLLKPSEAPSFRVHMYDRLWAPHGLVRYGVAPDHPEVKNCTNKFDDTANDPRFRFFGNVNVGDTPLTSIPHTHSLPLRSLLQNYTHVLFATGCTLSTLHPAIPPSEYCVPALSMVHWYTQHPSHVPPPDLRKISHVSLIGNGNVSLDIARILLTPPHVLEKYDVPTSVLDVLRQSAVKHVSIMARRGPLEAAFTTKELRELMNLPDASMVPLSSSILTSAPEMTMTRQQRRTLELLQKGSKNAYGSTPKTWSLEFYRSPTGLTPPTSSSPLAQLTLAHTELDPRTRRAISTGETSSLLTSLVITSLGFHADPQTTFYDPSLGHLRALAGRIISSSGTAIKNIYASGWSANGAKGVLASTMMDAYAVADIILSDITPGEKGVQTTATSSNPDMILSSEFQLNPNPHVEDPPLEILEGLKNGTVTTYDDWKHIDAEERRRGEAMDKERERMSWSDARTFMSQRAALH